MVLKNLCVPLLGFPDKAMAPYSSTLAWKIPWMEKPGRLESMGSLSQTRLSDFTFTFHFHALEKKIATHFSILAWRIPGMKEPGGLPSMGSHRVEQNWSDLEAAAAAAWASQVVLVVKNLLANAGDVRDEGSIPGLGKSLRGGHGNLLKYYCLENPMLRGS